MIKIPTLKTGHKIAAGTVLFIFLMAIFYGALNQTVEFFRTNTIVKHQILKTEWSWPLEIIKLTDLEKRQAQEKLLEEKSTEWARFILEGETTPAITPDPNDKTRTKDETSLGKLPSFFDTLWQHESTRGADSNDPTALHMYCRAKGKWNEIGYNPQAKYCFEDREHAELKIALYLKENCGGYTTAQCLCYYNTGKYTTTCPYAEGNLSMAN